ncbi:MAG: hypothetical protein HN742_33925 [Lentisphaerae bacterium]|jgi:hypothetical protein|nr:hypothetical protein [Lentisphaerota bacterium]MBT4815693.1 hypothetical protein [Lentisphaerota bacterium]MBT5611463.1 hypothetical protein [Lentisphaerota bacterium]MBT7061012.1 hypothetical protein [Lentisphaerota bacterium]MBT7846920.1 hypothetical protein [Lentisphaerota bacterium]
MKSAFELAMERLGGELQTYTDQQKAELAEVDGLYDSKVAQAKMDADSRLQTAAGEPEKAEQIRNDLVVELASVSERRERKKEELRNSFKKNG